MGFIWLDLCFPLFVSVSPALSAMSDMSMFVSMSMSVSMSLTVSVSM